MLSAFMADPILFVQVYSMWFPVVHHWTSTIYIYILINSDSTINVLSVAVLFPILVGRYAYILNCKDFLKFISDFGFLLSC